MTSTTSQALIPGWIAQDTGFVRSKTAKEILAVAFGVALIVALSKVAIPVPGTPVPITGQTFGVAVLALLWGSKRASLSVAGFLALGFTALPAFSMGRALFPLGPTSGYLIGMLFSSFWIGFLADRGAAKKFSTAFFSAWSGSALVFGFGLLNLSLYLPKETLFLVGVLPFLPGDLIKTTLAALIAVQMKKQFSEKKAGS